MRKGRKPKVRRHTRKGRSPWYTIQVCKKPYHLGTDYAVACDRAAEILQGAPQAQGRPLTVAGLGQAWVQETGAEKWKVAHFVAWATTNEVLLAGLNSLDGYVEYIKHVPLTGCHKGRHGMNPGGLRSNVKEVFKCLKWGKEKGWIKTLPPSPKMPRPPLTPRDIDPEQLFEALKHIRYMGFIIRFIVATGCRPSEACSIEWHEIDMRTNTIVLDEHKTRHLGKTRTIYLTPDALEVLSEVKKDKPYVFQNRFGNPCTPNAITQALNRQGLSGSYSLRHTAAQSMLEADVDSRVIAGLLGHSGLQTIQVYTHMRSKKLIEKAKGIKSPIAKYQKTHWHKPTRLETSSIS